MSVVAIAGAGVAYQAGVKYLPSVFIVVGAVMVTGIFAEIEDRLLAELDNPDVAQQRKYVLYLVRITRTLLLLVLGVVAIALALIGATDD